MKNVVEFKCPRFDINNKIESDLMKQYLCTNGYAVVKGIVTDSEIAAAKDNFWNFVENTQPLIDRKNPATWASNSWLADCSTGIFNRFGFNHSEFLWNARLNRLVRKAFESIWQTSELIVSFDAGNVFRPWSVNKSWATHGGWWHVDQNSLKGKDRQGRVCVQGLVTYYNADKRTGGLCVIPGSHLQHAELCARTQFAKLKHDFVQLDRDDPILFDPTNSMLNQLDALKSQLILFVLLPTFACCLVDWLPMIV